MNKINTDNIVFKFDLDTKRLLRAYDSTDDIGAVLRTQFEMERALDFLLEHYFSKPEELNLRYFAQKIGALKAVCVPSEYLEAFKHVNKVRNDMGHKGKEKLEEKDIIELYSIVNLISSKRLQEFVLNTPPLPSIDGCKIETLSLKDQFVTIASIALAKAVSLPEIKIQ